ncbi:VanZ family protein [Haloarcula sp. S1AR25-5A]|uniref:VanZ family protein n=1 Tax=Haloarcula terrestris TaxID=2950533 RepID=A0AAE4EXC9_9EURY|nr:VanZ family protein [Haloarcula terrestris]MDS0221921.1 VanZ family protein [Haloarcula terrestris]
MDWSGHRRYLPAVGFSLLLLVTSLLPVPEGASEQVPVLLGVALDKWVHAASYGVLAVLLAWGRRARNVVAVAVLVAVSVCYGAGVELLQGLVPSRGTSGADFVANAAGAVLAGLAWLAAHRSGALSDRTDPQSRQ